MTRVMRLDNPRPARRRPRWWLHLAVGVGVLAALGPSAPPGSAADGGWSPFSSFFDPNSFSAVEQIGLACAMVISLFALAYAWVLARKVAAAEKGTAGMQAIAEAVRDGSDAYLRRQFRTVGVLLIFLTLLIVLTKWPWNSADPNAGDLRVIAVTRGLAFLLGSVFSATVGFFGMRLATTGNLRVAAAARQGFAPAMRLGYQTGTVTGMLTTGLGLLGGCLIVLVMGEKAYETLLGFAFGGSLLALFMRVGGGIYTKAADVGADLVGKVEKDIPEDDPRNAATIADNVGDDVGDCAGMAADVFESYTVTMVAAMILGFAAFGTKAMMLPLFIMSIGIVSSMVSTSLVGRRESGGGSSGAMRSINNSFRFGAGLTVVGIFVLGAAFLRFDKTYIVTQAVERGLYRLPEFQRPLGLGPNVTPEAALAAWKAAPAATQAQLIEAPLAGTGTVFTEANQLVPLREGVDLRPAFACLIGVILTLALMFCTEYWTSTEFSPVQSITKNSRTGDATNIIQGIAVGYESTVWAVILIAAAVFSGVLIYQDTQSPLFVAFGVSLAGIGMLALTADTLSMDVFGPVADNANGIGEMGYNFDPRDHRRLSPGDPDYVPEDEVRA